MSEGKQTVETSVSLHELTVAIRPRRIKLTGELARLVAERRPVSSPRSAAFLLLAYFAWLELDDREALVAAYLDARLRVVGLRLVSIGTLNSSLAHPREIFAPAIGSVGRVASLVLAHNHPSGDVTPSADDDAITSRIQAAGELLGIPLMDHLIFDRGSGDFYSYTEHGRL